MCKNFIDQLNQHDPDIPDYAMASLRVLVKVREISFGFSVAVVVVLSVSQKKCLFAIFCCQFAFKVSAANIESLMRMQKLRGSAKPADEKITPSLEFELHKVYPVLAL